MRRSIAWPLLFGLLLAAGAGGLLVGSVRVSAADVVSILLGRPSPTTESDRIIIREIRLPRVLLAAAAGAGLAAAGAAYQGLFRNPLADPFIIGSASGAALGATLVLALDLFEGTLGLSAVALGAFVGALSAAVVVYALAGAGRGLSLAAILLTGAAVGNLLSAGVWVVLALDDRPMRQVFAWLTGSFIGKGWPELAATAPWLVVGIAGVWLLSRPLDALTGGEESARLLGLPVRAAAWAVLAFGCMATAAAVAAGGIIGFVGLMAPHLARALVGHRHILLIPAAALVGATLLLLADTGARVALQGLRAAEDPTELPVGVVTALLGAPFFLYVLRGKR
jgi:iron complex transport system permease protein